MIISKKTTQKTRRLLAVSAVLGMVIGIGLTAAVGGGVYYAYQQQADLFATSSQLEVRNLNAVRSGDTLTITANIKNVGSTSITNLAINEISTGENFRIYDSTSTDDRLNVESLTKVGLAGVSDGTTYHLGVLGTSGEGAIIDKPRGFGINSGSDDVSLDGGGSTAFQLRINYTDTLIAATSGNESIDNSVRISDRLTFQLFFKAGQDQQVSDVYNTRVRPG